METSDVHSFGEILAEARNGSQEALGVLLDKYRGYLCAIANEHIGAELGAKVAASDVVQETFVATHRAFRNFRGATENELKAWLRTALVNCVKDTARSYYRNRKRDLSRELPAQVCDSKNGQSILPGLEGGDSTPSVKLMRAEQIESLKALLLELPDIQREVVVRRGIQNESFTSIGESLGRSPDAVRMIWRRAFRKIFEQMTGRHA